MTRKNAKAHEQGREARGIPHRRRKYRPAKVRVLLVGESAPSAGTHYYFANSKLFQAIRESARRVYGAKTPAGLDFLPWAQAHGLWLVDLARFPVDDLGKAERRAAAWAGVRGLAQRLRRSQPKFVVAVLTSIQGPVWEAVEQSGIEAEVTALPFPSRRWEDFCSGLEHVLRRARRATG